MFKLKVTCISSVDQATRTLTRTGPKYKEAYHLHLNLDNINELIIQIIVLHKVH